MRDRELAAQSKHANNDPEDWTTGDKPMTGSQASYLKTLRQQAGKEALVDPQLTTAQAAQLIDQLRAETGRGRDDGGSAQAETNQARGLASGDENVS